MGTVRVEDFRVPDNLSPKTDGQAGTVAAATESLLSVSLSLISRAPGELRRKPLRRER